MYGEMISLTTGKAGWFSGSLLRSSGDLNVSIFKVLMLIRVGWIFRSPHLRWQKSRVSMGIKKPVDPRWKGGHGEPVGRSQGGAGRVLCRGAVSYLLQASTC